MSTKPIRVHHILVDTRDKRVCDLNQILSCIHVFPLPFAHIDLIQMTYLYT